MVSYFLSEQARFGKAPRNGYIEPHLCLHQRCYHIYALFTKMVIEFEKTDVIHSSLEYNKLMISHPTSNASTQRQFVCVF